MEDSRTLKVGIILILVVLVPYSSSSYGIDTHALLSGESARLFNEGLTGIKFANGEIQFIEKGAREEDNGKRWLQHFYDPIANKGLTYPGISFQSSKQWSQDTLAQATTRVYDFSAPLYGTVHNIFSGQTDYSWERAIYDYAWGNKERGLESLGHVLHLIQDAAVPDHTRNDPHPGLGKRTSSVAPQLLIDLLEKQHHTNASPYENFATNRPFEKPKKTDFPLYENIDDYFLSMATYSNNNFFSKDTLPIESEFKHQIYNLPSINLNEISFENLNNGEIACFSYSNKSSVKYKLALVKGCAAEIGPWREIKEISKELRFDIEDPDNLVVSDYWNALSKQAVLHGAGVIKLFFDEIEKEKKSKVLYEKNRSWFAKKIDEFKTGSFALASLLYGSSVKQSDLDEESEAVSEPTPLVEKTKPSAASAETIEAPPSAPPPEAVLEAPALEPPAEAPITITPEEPKIGTLPEILLPPVAGSILGGSGAGVVETPPVIAVSGAIPTISLSIDECSSSLATDGCLVTGTGLTISWSSSSTDIARYEIECEISGASCPGFSFNEHGTSTAYTASDGAAYTFRAQSISEPGNRSVETTASVTVHSRPVVINEVAWMGTSASRSSDEWIELKNVTAFSINLSQWVLYSQTDLKPYLNLTGTIAANGYYLIERTDDTATNVTADLTAAFGSGTGSGLSNSGEILVLAYASTSIDQTPSLCNGSWCGGNNTTYFTMERYDPDAAGNLSSNWGSNNQSVAYGQNADGLQIWGTPRGRNSLNHRIILGSNSTLTESKTLIESHSPYVISEAVMVNQGVTLTVEPGVVIKFGSNGELKINGALKASGISDKKITFTSIKDDTAGGDTNGDGAESAPAKGDWKKITLKGSGSEFAYAEVRYGGRFSGNDSSESRAMIYASNASVTITNSTIEKSYNIGISLQNATSSMISGNIIRNNDSAQDPGFAPNGISIGGGGEIQILNNTFEANRTGIDISNSSPEVTSNSFTAHLYRAISLNQGSAGTVFSGNTAANNPFNGIYINDTVLSTAALSANLPYTGIINVHEAGTLAIPAGSVLKSVNLTSSGLLQINGTGSNQAVFTALTDDRHGGDSDNNGDNSAACSANPSDIACPQPGAWSRITISGNTATSSISHALIRFGNKSPANGSIYINGGRADIQNTTVEYSQNQGIQITPIGIASISASTFRNNGTGISNDGSLTLAGSTFRNNTTGLASPIPSTFVDGGGNDIDSSNTTRTTPATLLP